MEMLDYLLSALNDVVIAFNEDEQSYIFVSPGIENITGYHADDFKKKDHLWNDLVYKPDRQKTDLFITAIMSLSEKQITYRIQNLKGQIVWVQEKRVQFIYDRNGQTITLSVIKDITDIVLYKEETKEQVWFLKSLIEAQEALIFRVNESACYTYLNNSYTRILGYPQNSLIGKSILDIVHKEDTGNMVAMFQDCLRNPGKIVTLLHRKINVMGDVRWIETKCVAVANYKGEILEVQGTGFDISEIIEARKSVQDMLDKLNFYINSVTDAFFILDKNWKFVRTNTAFEKLFNKTPNSSIGLSAWEVLPEILGTASDNKLQKSVDEQVTVKFSTFTPETDRWLRIAAYPSEEGLAVLIRDITLEKNAQERALWTKHNLEGIINNTDDLIWSINTDKIYVFVNDAYKKWLRENFGITHVEGSRLYQQLYNSVSSIEEWEAYYDRVLLGNRFSIIYQSIDQSNDELLSFDVSFNPIYDESKKITGAGCFARNITQKLKAEKSLREQHERLINIASLSSHELRRPVATIIGLIDILDKNDLSNPDNYEVVEHLHTEAMELDEVIRLIVNKVFIKGI